MRNETKNSHGDKPISAIGHETGDVPYHLAVKAGVIIIVVLLVTVFGLRFVFDWKSTRLASKLKFMKDSTFQLEPEVRNTKPMLQVDAAEDLREIRAEENRQLHTFGWLDRQAGRVRVPIEQAMQTVVNRGLPTRGGAK